MPFVFEKGEQTHTNYYSPKLLALYFIAVSPSLGTAVAALGRLVLFGMALLILVHALRHQKTLIPLHVKTLTIVILLTVAYMGMSVFWSTAELPMALNAWTRHARLLNIVLIFLLISNRAEGQAVLCAFVLGQLFVVLSSWLLVMSVNVPWATALKAKTTYAVFGSYLEQSVSQSVIAAILWFQRHSIFGKRGRWLAIALALVSIVLSLGFLIGRTGALVGLALISLAIVYEIPRRHLRIALLVPIVVAFVCVGASKTLRDRLFEVKTEISAYSDKGVFDSSSGLRLLFWQVALQSAAKSPVVGHGAGSWNPEFRLLEAGRSPSSMLKVSDPHQLFLLWLVEGGLVGLGLLTAVFVSIFYSAQRLSAANARSAHAVLLALVVSGLFNSMIFGIGMGDFFCVAFGVLLCISSKPQDA